MSKVSKDIVMSYSTCDDQGVLQKFQNIIDSFWHKDEGLLFSRAVKDVEAGTHTFYFRNSNGKEQKIEFDLPKADTDTEKPISYITDLQKALDDTVKKVDGKGLSTNDLTNELLQKLQGLKNYVHPEKHQMSEVEGLPEFVKSVPTNLQQLTEGGNQTNLPIKVGGIELPSADGLGVVLTDTTWILLSELAKASDIEAIMAILQSPDTTLDELKEIVPYIKANRDIFSNLDISNIAGLVDALSKKASKTDLLDYLSRDGGKLRGSGADGAQPPLLSFDESERNNIGLSSGSAYWSVNIKGAGDKYTFTHPSARGFLFLFFKDGWRFYQTQENTGGVGSAAVLTEIFKISDGSVTKNRAEIATENFVGSVEQLLRNFIANSYVAKSGASTIEDTKTFTSSPVIPNPTLEKHAATKEYVDNLGEKKADKSSLKNIFPIGLKGQSLYQSENGDNILESSYNVVRGTVVNTQEELDAALGTQIDQKKIFDNYRLKAYSSSGRGAKEPSPPNFPGFLNQESGSSVKYEEFANNDVWRYDEVTRQIKSNKNYSQFTCLVSPNRYTSYSLAATMSSADIDDDQILLVMAYATDSENDYEHTLTIRRSISGANYAVAYNLDQDNEKTLIRRDELAPQNSFTGWSNVKTRVIVERDADIFRVKCSQFSETNEEIDNNTLIEFSINDFPELEVFRSGGSIGFGSLSQIDATFSNIVFSELTDYVVDARNFTDPDIYRYDQDTNNYFLDRSADYKKILPLGKKVWNETTEKLYYITLYGILFPGNTGSNQNNSSGSETITPVYFTWDGNDNIIDWPYDVLQVMQLVVDRQQVMPDEYNVLGNRQIEITAPNLLNPGSKIYAQLKHNPQNGSNL